MDNGVWPAFGLARHSHRPHRAQILVLISGIMLTLLLSGCSVNRGSPGPLSGHIVVHGSTALQPLATSAAQLFMKANPGVQIVVDGGGSVSGLQAVTNHTADIGDSDIYADPATYPDPTMSDHLVCVVPFTIVVNPDVPLQSLKRDDIIKIFSTSELTNWKQLGGPDLAITPVVRPQTSGTRATFRKYVLDGRDEKGTLLATDSSDTVRNTVASTPGAVGYLAASYINTSVHVVNIDGQQPTLENIEAGSYTFWSFEHMYTVGDTTPAIDAFLDFMLTDEVQQLASSQHYIPIATMKLIPSTSLSSAPTSNIGGERAKQTEVAS